MTRVLLALDYSTSATGWAKFNMDTKELIAFGVILPSFKNPKTKGIPKYAYPTYQVLKLRVLAAQILEIIDHSVEKIVIEEINGGSRASRISQKVLDGGHFVLLEKMPLEVLSKVIYVDSDGNQGWRSRFGLGLQLNEHDKNLNKERKKLNKKLAKGSKKFPIVTQKTLACRFANRQFSLTLDCDKEVTDGDAADALGLGFFTLTKVLI